MSDLGLQGSGVLLAAEVLVAPGEYVVRYRTFLDFEGYYVQPSADTPLENGLFFFAIAPPAGFPWGFPVEAD